MVQQLETAPSEASEGALPVETGADVPASPASLWTSESRAHYSITHVDRGEARAWIDCDCVIHGD
jgi:hypothetical protein